MSSAPAPRFDRVSTFRSWIQPNIHTSFSVTGGPAIVLCNGYAASGLPLAMQIAGRPFDDATVLRAAHAYERTMAWRTRRPQLTPGAGRVSVTPPALSSGVPVEDASRSFAERRAARAGLKLNDAQLTLLAEVVPYALAMARRIPREFSHEEEPANTFHLSPARSLRKIVCAK